MQNRPIEQKVLVLGASGFIGSALIRNLDTRSFAATYLTRPIQSGVRFDIARQRLRDQLLRAGHGFTHALLAQGVTNLEQCARMRHSAAAVNVDGALRAIDDLLDAGVHPIFLSSDAVFDGGPGLRTEIDEPFPILSYGRDKLEVEAYLAERECPWTVLRLTKVIAGFSDRRNLLSQWLEQIALGRLIRCAIDQFLTPVDIEYVVRAIWFVIATSVQGVFHIAGSEMVTRYELLQHLLARAPDAVRRAATVQSCSLDEFAGIEPLPHNCALSSEKFITLSGIRPRSLEDLCEELCARVYPGLGVALAPGG
jgi:dTDP-4-dehydrorhamnose reductase